VKRSLAGCALVLLLLTSALTPFVAAAADGSENSTDGYTLEELRRGGTTVGNGPESIRMTDQRMFWLIHWPASAVTSTPGEDDSWAHVEPGGRVDRNAVYLRTFLFESETVTVRIVSWREGERTVRRGNVTETVPIATNVTESTHKAELGLGRPTAKVPLPQHNRPTHVTMWIEEYPSARWRFEHKSVATTQSAGISSEGDYLVRLATDVIGPALVGIFVVGFLIRKAIDKAGVGPLKGLGFWIFALGILGAGGLLLAFDSIAELLVAAPKVLAVGLVAIVAIVMLETWTGHVERWDFVQLETTPATSPSGEDRVDARGFAKRHERIIRMPDGGMAVVRPGIIRFLARCFGGASRLRNAGEIRTEIRETGSSRTDKMILTHPEHDDGPLEYEGEGFELAMFDEPADPHADEGRQLDRAAAFKSGFSTLAVTFFVGAIVASPFPSSMTGAAVLGAIFLNPWSLAAGAVAFAVTGLRASDSYSLVVPAPAHLTAAFASSAILAEEFVEGETIEEFAEENRKLRVRDQREIEERVAEGDRTLIEEMHGFETNDRERSENGSESAADLSASANGSGERTDAPRDDAEGFRWDDEPE